MPELLLELFCEEIPARMQARASEDFARLVADGLKQAGLATGTVQSFVTPRRLALALADVPAAQADVREERRGPRVGAPDQAVQGFLKGAGLASLDQCERREVKGVDYWFAVIEKKGGATVAALPGIVEAAIRGIAWPKSMRWAATSFSYVRPLHSIVVLFDGKVVPGRFDAGGGVTLPFGNTTRGHRFLSPSDFPVSSVADYKQKLRLTNVLADRAERRAAIWDLAQKAAAQQGLAVQPDEALLDEVTGLVEWPVPLIGRIDDDSMELPPEVLVTSMRTHQRYFALNDKAGKMAPFFLTVANMKTPDNGKTIVAGNERVLRARLADARFFWQTDRKVQLASRVKPLDAITWHAKLGDDSSLGKKVRRIGALAQTIADFVPGADTGAVMRAAHLAKADLTSGMVGEFPELQGVMGRYYARHDREPAEIADAIAEHWAPQGPQDACPTKPVSVAVALADKIDSLVAFFWIKEHPTGSKDPFGLRRAALGAIRLIVENKLRLPLRGAIGASKVTFTDLMADEVGRRLDNKPPGYDPTSDLLAFFADRLKVALREKGVRHDLIDAVFALGGEDDLVRLLARVAALQAFVDSDDGRNLLAAYKRAMNIVRIEAKKDKVERFAGAPDARLFAAPEEKALGAALDSVQAGAGEALQREDFAAAMRALASLRAPLDAFFDKVTVNASEPGLRINRLKMLQEIGAAMNRIADFSKVEG